VRTSRSVLRTAGGESPQPTLPHFCTRSRKWGSFIIGRKTIKKRMRARLLAIKMELRKTMHDRIAKIGAWMKRTLQGHLNYFAVSGNHV
jgi:RNA-directed DNA polymerase